MLKLFVIGALACLPMAAQLVVPVHVYDTGAWTAIGAPSAAANCSGTINGQGNTTTQNGAVTVIPVVNQPFSIVSGVADLWLLPSVQGLTYTVSLNCTSGTNTWQPPAMQWNVPTPAPMSLAVSAATSPVTSGSTWQTTLTVTGNLSPWLANANGYITSAANPQFQGGYVVTATGSGTITVNAATAPPSYTGPPLQAIPTSGWTGTGTLQASGPLTIAQLMVTAYTPSPGVSVTMGGDVSGQSNAALVTGLQGVPIASTSPANGQALVFNGAQYVPGSLAAAGVSSFNSRTGVVVPQTGDYTAAQVTNAVSTLGTYSNPSWITGIPWSILTGSIPIFNQNTTGSAATLSGSLSQCSGDQFALGISANGNAVCGSPPGSVTSVFGRTGAVTAQAGDYSASQITNAVSTIGSYANPSWITAIPYSILSGSVPTWNQSTTGNAATSTALAAIPSQCSSGNFSTGIQANGTANCSAPTGQVSSVFGRTGAVTAQSGDYTAAQVTNAVSTLGSYATPSWITAINWSIITAGSPPIFNQNTTGSAATLSGSLTGCTAPQFSEGIASNGNSTCATAVTPTTIDNASLAISVTTAATTGNLNVGGNVVTTSPVSTGPAYASGASGCAASTTQVVTFSNGGGSGALGTVTINGSGIPTGVVTITSGGTGYTSVPTAGTIATCSVDSPVFTGGSLQGYLLAALNGGGLAQPSSGTTNVGVEATGSGLADLFAMDSSGNLYAAVLTGSGPVSNQFGTYVDNHGVMHTAQPSAANLSNGVTGSGAAVLAMAPAITGGLTVTGGTVSDVLTIGTGPSSLAGGTTFTGGTSTTGGAITDSLTASGTVTGGVFFSPQGTNPPTCVIASGFTGTTCDFLGTPSDATGQMSIAVSTTVPGSCAGGTLLATFTRGNTYPHGPKQIQLVGSNILTTESGGGIMHAFADTTFATGNGGFTVNTGTNCPAISSTYTFWYLLQ